MDLNSQYIGSFIKFMRKRAGLTQNQLAERIGVGSKTISKWEQGRGIPDISFLYSLSLELDVDIESLLAGNVDDIGREWIGIISIGDAEEGEDLGRRQWERMMSMFLLAGIREIVVICHSERICKPDALLEEYREKGFFRRTLCVDSASELIGNLHIEEKHICWMYQPAFLYGMHMTRYMRRAMLGGKTTVLVLRQGKGSFMPGICFGSDFSCVRFGETLESEWRMFPMIFGQGRKITGYLEQLKGKEDAVFDADTLFGYFAPVHAEVMERAMLAFSFRTIMERDLGADTLSRIEESQHIRIGDLEEIMRVRGWG